MKTEDGRRESGVVDLWREDTKQDSWFTQSALDIGFKWLEDKYPGFSVYLFSGKCLCYLYSNVTMCIYRLVNVGEKESLIVHDTSSL